VNTFWSHFLVCTHSAHMRADGHSHTTHTHTVSTVPCAAVQHTEGLLLVAQLRVSVNHKLYTMYYVVSSQDIYRNQH
jgi:hypothetical protein